VGDVGTVLVGTGIPTGAYVVNQQWGASGTSVANTTATGTINTNTMTVVSATGIVIGQLIAGNGAAATGIPNGTYVANLVGTTVTLSNSLTAALSVTAVYFYTPGSTGSYTISSAATATTTGLSTTSNGVYFAGGGGGSCFSSGNPGIGGAGGGAAGLPNAGSGYAPSGVRSTGGGGGGTRNGIIAGAGGSGVVIIRYSDAYGFAAVTTGSPTVTTAGGYRVYKFTSSGTITF
jgi:hypothetical protein